MRHGEKTNLGIICGCNFSIAVIGIPDEKWGEAVRAFIVLKRDKTRPLEQDLVEFCINQGLSRYKAPKSIRFIESLPKNENGKIIKKALKDM